MKQTTLGCFKEKFGDIEVILEHNFFSLLRFDHLKIKITNKQGGTEILTEFETVISLNNNQILKRLHQYQIKNKFERVLNNAEGFKELEQLFIKYNNFPISLLNKTFNRANDKIQSLKGFKSIALVDEIPEISGFKEIFILGNVKIQEIRLRNQNLTILSDVSCDILSEGHSKLKIEKNFIGNVYIDQLELGSNCNFQGDIQTNKVMVNKGCKIHGTVNVGEEITGANNG